MNQDKHVFKGMERKTSEANHNKEFLWDAHNIRFESIDGQSNLSISKDPGNIKQISIPGMYLGHCIAGEYLIVFTKDPEDFCYILRITIGLNCEALYVDNDHVSTLDFSFEHPIEAHYYYESEIVQKVYWTDGVNPLRMINIVQDKYLQINKDDCIYIEGTNIVNLNDMIGYDSRSFDFVQPLKLNEEVTIRQVHGNGSFQGGVILYAMTYYNKYCQQSNVFYTSPLQYIAFKDRGAKPDETVNVSFEITVRHPDTRFRYLRIYSIQRTSIDATPICRIVKDVEFNSNKDIVVTDTGTYVSDFDPSELLYLGGRDFVAQTLQIYKNTLFAANLTLKDSERVRQIRDELAKIRNLVDGEGALLPGEVIYNSAVTNVGDYYNNNLDSIKDYHAGFKAGETYRIGIQAQIQTGEWLEPVWLGDKILTGYDSYPDSRIQIIQYSSTLFLEYVNKDARDIVHNLLSLGVKKLRPCVVFPTINDRSIIALGVLCPTLYNFALRANSVGTYVQSSWFFREYTHNAALPNGGSSTDTSIEIQSMDRPVKLKEDGTIDEENLIEPVTLINDLTGETGTSNYGNFYFIDSNIVTFHSPDIEFDPATWALDMTGVLLRIFGLCHQSAYMGRLLVQAGAAADYTIHNDPDFSRGLPVGSISPGYSRYSDWALVTRRGFVDALVPEELSSSNMPDFTKLPHATFKTYLWHRSGSLNNDKVRSDLTRTAELKKKITANLKYFGSNSTMVTGDRPNFDYAISTPKLFNSDAVTSVRVWVDYLKLYKIYMGNINTLSTTGNAYRIMYHGSHETEGTFVKISKDPISIKYKSSPHLVFSLENFSGKLRTLPTISASSSSDVTHTFYPPSAWENANTDITIENIDPGVLKKADFITEYRSEMGVINTPVEVNFARDEAYVLYTRKGGSEAHIFVQSVSADGTVSLQPLLLSEDHTLYFEVGPETYVKGWSLNIAGEILMPLSYALRGVANNIRLYEGAKFMIRAVKSGTSNSMPVYSVNVISYIPGTGTPSGGGIEVSTAIINPTDNGINTPVLYLADIYRPWVNNRFGGDTEDALKKNVWVPAGDPVALTPLLPDTGISLPFKYGDTWFSRYDCLKTYPFSTDDINQVVEIGSFMCETRVNIDGMVNGNRGDQEIVSVTNTNFNQLNRVYSLKDNFRMYQILDKDFYKTTKFSNQLTWSRPKYDAQTIDPWVNLSLSSIFNVDGDYGSITALPVFQDQLMCFQKKAINILLFDSRVLISTSDSVPIEIANSKKLDSFRTITDTIGCANKWSIANAEAGLYFIDDNTGLFYAYDGKAFNDLTQTKGMRDWFIRYRSSDPENAWANNEPLIKAQYDERRKEIILIPSYCSYYSHPKPGETDALCFSEGLAGYTSFLSHGGVGAFINFGGETIQLAEDSVGNTGIWRSIQSVYEEGLDSSGTFYDNPRQADITFISNDNPQVCKIFDNLEYNIYSPYESSSLRLQDLLVITHIEAVDSYQETGEQEFKPIQKFRTWRALLPRLKDTRNRLRDNWLKIKLTLSNNEFKLHNITVNYT